MPAKYKAEAYLYTSARVRAIEAGLLGADRIRTLAGAGSVAEVLAALANYGYEIPVDGAGKPDIDAMLTGVLARGIKALGALPDKSLTCLVQYPYDCHNIKACLKAPRRGLDPASLLIDMGSLPAAALADAVATGHYDMLLPHMAAAVPAAMAAFEKTGDPREIDFALDAACFADMQTDIGDFAFGAALLCLRTDTVNLATAMRLSAMTDPDLRGAVFEKAILPGGSLDSAVLTAILTGEKSPAEAVAGTRYAPLLADSPAPALFERRAEDLQMKKLREARYITYGPEVPLAYFFALDTEIKNLRIVLAGKAAGLESAAILERVRESYV